VDPGGVRCCPPTASPSFGICLGHQILALAAGGDTYKLPYGHRGGKTSRCRDLLTRRCYITSQKPRLRSEAGKRYPATGSPGSSMSTMATSEGIRARTRPYFSVQFHPEASPGPEDYRLPLRRLHAPSLARWRGDDHVRRLSPPQARARCSCLARGALQIGQAGEVRLLRHGRRSRPLKEEGIATVLINPNIATIQTSEGYGRQASTSPQSLQSSRSEYWSRRR